MIVTRSTRMHCIATVSTQFQVADVVIQHLMGKDGMSEAEAIEHAIENNLGEVVEGSYSADIDEEIATHEVTYDV